MVGPKQKRQSGFTRKRTGCLTCRQRKLKCDEVKPACGPCRKSKRECDWLAGLTFRHQQNAGVSKSVDNHLNKFYNKNAAKYTSEQRGNFLPVPEQLQWKHTTNPYARDSRREEALYETADENPQQVAAHSLNALAEAAQQPAYHHASAPTYIVHDATTVIDPSLQSHPSNHSSGPSAGTVSGIVERPEQDRQMDVTEQSVAEALKQFSGTNT